MTSGNKFTKYYKALRLKYLEKKDCFLEESIKLKEPFNIFSQWLDQATKTEEILEPKVACLATVNKDGAPSNRLVQITNVTTNDLTFFTNYGSRKAKEIHNNPNVALTIYWCPLRRCVRIEGLAKKLPQIQSEQFFRSLSRATQIATLASEQGKLIQSRCALDELEIGLKLTLGENTPVPMPYYGGFLVKPCMFEFWQGQWDRLHDRIRFRRNDNAMTEVDGEFVKNGDDGWVYERLEP